MQLRIEPAGIMSDQRIARGRELQHRHLLRILQRQNSRQMKRRREIRNRHRRRHAANIVFLPVRPQSHRNIRRQMMHDPRVRRIFRRGLCRTLTLRLLHRSTSGILVARRRLALRRHRTRSHHHTRQDQHHLEPKASLHIRVDPRATRIPRLTRNCAP